MKKANAVEDAKQSNLRVAAELEAATTVTQNCVVPRNVGRQSNYLRRRTRGF